MLIRMLFSCLVDADFLDTEAHMRPEATALRDIAAPSLPNLETLLLQRLREFDTAAQTEVNDMRREVLRSCIVTADAPPGVFTLTAPTGTGKTLSSLAFAFRHALRNDMHRVIVAIPYTTIIEQTASTYREILGDAAVLEHHSAIEARTEPDAEPGAAELAAENWDRPLVVTTTVQLFESLLANRPSRCRKLHNLARSVIVLDEVQTLPVEYLAPIVSVLAQLVSDYHVTVLLCTATQPVLQTTRLGGGLPPAREIINDVGGLFSRSRRVSFKLPCLDHSWEWARVADEMTSHSQALCVVNTKGDAVDLFTELDDGDALHLSTSMCPAHRSHVLDTARHRLRHRQPCRLVSTQVIEAGVDLDFPLVMRALGPMDRIVQAAGRCNREGLLDHGMVVVFRTVEDRMPPGAYRTASDTTLSLLNQCGASRLLDPDVSGMYFGRLYQAVDSDARGIQCLRARFDFPEVAHRFSFIDDDSVPVVVRYESPRESHAAGQGDLAAMLASARDSRTWNRHWFRRLQSYTVAIRRRQYTALLAQGLITEIIPDALGEWLGRYDPHLGLRFEGLDPELLIFA